MPTLTDLVAQVQKYAATLANLTKTRRPPILHGPPPPAALAQALGRLSATPPPSYRALLELHDGWEHFWSGFTIVGASGPHTQAALEDIALTAKEDTTSIEERWTPDKIAQRERDKPDFVYLPHHIVFATDFNGQLGLFDCRSVRSDREMEVVLWSPAGVTERHDSLTSLFEAALRDIQREITEKKGEG